MGLSLKVLGGFKLILGVYGFYRLTEGILGGGQRVLGMRRSFKFSLRVNMF